jgi:hypothetical protein
MTHFTRRHPYFLVVLAASIVACAALVVRGQEKRETGFADPVLGRWDLTVQGASGPYPSWLEVDLRTEQQLQGRLVGQSGSVRHATEIDYRGGELTVVVPIQYEKGKNDLRFQAKLVGDKLEGTLQQADGTSAKFTGVRAPVMATQPPPSWGQPITLFNGKDTSGWKTRRGSGDCWKATDGTLVNVPPCADLISDQTFKDFKLHLEFMYPAGSNSGVYLRGRYEVQIEDSAGKALSSHRLGGVYGFLTPYLDAGKPAGEWQTYDITLVGRRVTVVLNAKTIIRDEVIPGITGGALDSDESAPGPLMLQGDHGKISFRNISLTPAQ